MPCACSRGQKLRFLTQNSPPHKVEDQNSAERVSYSSAEVSEVVHGHPFHDACTFSGFVDGDNESLVLVLVLVLKHMAVPGKIKVSIKLNYEDWLRHSVRMLLPPRTSREALKGVVSSESAKN